MNTILILAVNSADTRRLRFDKEVSDIQQTLRQSQYRDEFHVISMGVSSD